ncbi:DNA-directed RNA polymerase subunit alpha C-terminal domain-containing protein [Streptosporangium sandarakinum]|uniref:DNA-directed RNA polymerase subunit alpha C-terminal domain-containing protein n=1 Tax=Streptosporangium sandarakinum TaxID=1260955 RepID=UPI00369E32B3
MPEVHLSASRWKMLLYLLDRLAQARIDDSGDARRLHILISNQLGDSILDLDTSLADLVDRTGLPLETPLEEVMVGMGSARILKCLGREGIHTMRHLRRRTYDDLLDIRNIGIASIKALKRRLWMYVEVHPAVTPLIRHHVPLILTGLAPGAFCGSIAEFLHSGNPRSRRPRRRNATSFPAARLVSSSTTSPLPTCEVANVGFEEPGVSWGTVVIVGGLLDIDR